MTYDEIAPKKWPTTKQLLLRIRQNPMVAGDIIGSMLKANVPVSRDVILALVHQNVWAASQILNYVDDYIKLAAVQKSGRLIGVIKNPTIAMQIAAVTSDFNCIETIAKSGPVAEEVVRIAVAHNGDLIRYATNPSESLQLEAVKKSDRAISFIEHPSEATQILACQTWGKYGLEWIVYDYKHNYRAKIVTKSAVLAAFSKDPINVLEMFDRDQPLEHDYQWTAFKANPGSYHLLKKFPNFDPQIAVEWETWARRRDRDVRLPLLGKGPQTADLNQDQLRLLRWMDQNHQNSISVRTLKSLTWGNTPTLAALARSTGGKDITRAMVQNNRNTHSTAMELVTAADVSLNKWTGVQRMFEDRDNMVAVYGVNGATLEDSLALTDRDKSHFAVIRRGAHPLPRTSYHREPPNRLMIDPIENGIKFFPNRLYTIGWVRFTLFGKNIWIDEVQSDLLSSVTNTDNGERVTVLEPQTAAKIKDLNDAILLDFLRRMRRRGAQKFYMPTYDMKKTDYDSDPPESIYKELPRKMRFKLGTVDGIDDHVNGREAWILESR